MIRILSPGNDQQTAIEQYPAPLSTVMKTSVIFPVPGYAEMGQHIIYINEPVPQEIFLIKKPDSNIHTRNLA